MRRDFVANVSHELRTPLTVISGYLETLLDSESPALAAWRQPLSGMQQQSRRMLHIVEDLLMLARLETQRERPPRKPVPVPVLLTDIAGDAIALSGEQGHRIEVDADPALWLLGCEKECAARFPIWRSTRCAILRRAGGSKSAGSPTPAACIWWWRTTAKALPLSTFRD